ncbi:X-ray radiation resistance-associated protein 1 [Amblyraja radiata]|uniref:X-ray radiation resistance-associated protein 1 n=1 Tax=Amblyraja radiata TaxID=386614 RepID=UPI0014032FC7|nr:X-ray radiation resistance-associated protein 1 [Amblyraja radiata]
MTFKGQYRLDDGASAATDCFPVRKIFKRGYQSAGHWVEAQTIPKQKDFQAVLGPKLPTQRTLAAPSPTVKPPNTQRTKPSKEKVLDGNYLMSRHCVDDHSDLCVVNINDQGLNAVNDEDFHLFDNVAFINAAENQLPLEPFRFFLALRELDLSLNGLRKLLLTTQDFLNLEVLNLSYNSVNKEDVLALGLLPHLKVLHLTGNDLDSLTPNLAALYSPLDSLDAPLLRFPVLEVLMLDENRFSDPCVLSSLAGLHRLKYLNLDHNYLTGVPYLQQMELFELSEKGGGADLCYNLIHQVKEPIVCPTLTMADSLGFQSDIRIIREQREHEHGKNMVLEQSERLGGEERTEEWQREWG